MLEPNPHSSTTAPADLGNSGESVKKIPFNQMNKAIERASQVLFLITRNGRREYAAA